MALVTILSLLVLLTCEFPKKSHSQCVELNDRKCVRRPSEGLEFNDCACLFNHNTTTPNNCESVTETLGLNCSRPDGLLAYVVNELPDDAEEIENASNKTLCVLERVCQCLSREANHKLLVKTEKTCRQYCLQTSGRNRTRTTIPLSREPIDLDVCQRVHSQYCRRHGEDGRPQECAAYCAQEDTCVSECGTSIDHKNGESLIEGILEDEFVGNDMDAAILMMTEIQALVQPVKSLLGHYGSLYDAIERDENTAISYFNDTNSEVLMSLFDDLLSDDRLVEWMELQQEEEMPGTMTLERLERTSYLLGRSQQLRMQLEPFTYGGTNMDMNVECLDQSSTDFTQVFQGGALLDIKEMSFSSTMNCPGVVSAVLSSNLGPLLLSTAFANITQVNTDVMTVQALGNMGGRYQFTDIRISLPALNNSNSFYNAKCVYWNTTQCQWSSDGVVLLNENATHYTCQSSHLTSFAVLVSIHPVSVSKTEAVALSVVSYIGCTVSIICLVITLVLMIILRKLLNKGVLLYIHFNLFLALLLALTIFVSGIETAVQVKWLCSTVAALLHYLFLCVFCWMLAEGILLYALVVKPFTTNFKKWYYLLPIGWGLPLPIVAVSVGLRHNYYGTSTFCWLSVQSGVIWSFTGPMLAIIVVNSLFLLLTIVSVVQVKRKASINANLSDVSLIVTSIKSAIVLLPLLGVTWIIGLFAVNRNTTVFAWTFTILNSLQGTMIFVLHILRNKRVRKWLLGKAGLERVLMKSHQTDSTSKLPSTLPHFSKAGKDKDTLPKSRFESSENQSSSLEMTK